MVSEGEDERCSNEPNSKKHYYKTLSIKQNVKQPGDIALREFVIMLYQKLKRLLSEGIENFNHQQSFVSGKLSNGWRNKKQK